MTPQEQPDSHQDCTFDAITGKELTHRSTKLVAVLPDSQAGNELDELLRPFRDALFSDDAISDESDQLVKTEWFKFKKDLRAYAERLATERAVVALNKALVVALSVKDLQVIAYLNESINELAATLTKGDV